MVEHADRVLKSIEKVLFYLSGVVCVLVTLMIVVDVFLRAVFNHPLPASWEISEVCMPFIVFYAFAYTLTMNAHIRVTFITSRVSPKLKFWLHIFGNSLCFVICALLTYFAFLHFWQSFIIREEILAAIKIPWWIGKSAMPVGMAMLSLRYLMQMILSLNKGEVITSNI